MKPDLRRIRSRDQARNPGWRALAERGATLVEAAIVAPVFFFLLFSVFQVAFVARAELAARYGVSAGVRAGGVASDDPLADFDVLHDVNRSASTLAKGGVVRVIVYTATDMSTAVPQNCLSGPITGLCNVYSDADLNRPATDFGPGGWTGDNYWPPSSRDSAQSGQAQYIGVYVQVTVGHIVGPFPQTISKTSVSRIQPTSA